MDLHSRESVQASLSLFSHTWLTLAQCSPTFNVNARKVKNNVIIDKTNNLCSWWTLWSWIARLAILSLSVYNSHEVRVKSGLIWHKDDRWDVALKTWVFAKIKVVITLPASQAILVTPEREIYVINRVIILHLKVLTQKYTVSWMIILKV